MSRVTGNLCMTVLLIALIALGGCMHTQSQRGSLFGSAPGPDEDSAYQDSYVDQKVERQVNRQQSHVEWRIDHETDQAVDSVVDEALDSIFN